MHSITMDGMTRPFPDGTNVAAIFDTFYPERRPRPVAASLHGRIRQLDWQPDMDCALAWLDYTDDEGRRIYERSLRFLLLLAVRDVLPGARVRIEHSVGYGLYVDIDASLDDNIVKQIEHRMRALQLADLPFTRERWSREKAIDYFTQLGDEDKVKLLAYRPHDYFDVFRCGGMAEYFYGDMLPSTGHITTFALLHHAPGIVLQMPLPENPDEVAPFAERPKMMQIFAESARWHRILECDNVADLNEMIERGSIREFVRVNEALQEKSISGIADRIARRHAQVMFIAGPSSSGKTTFTNRLAVQLRVLGLRPIMLSMDNYYRNKATLPLGPDGMPDLESLDALDVALLGDQLGALLRGEEVVVPYYSFKVGERQMDRGTRLHIEDNMPLLIEGIHGLNPRLLESIPRDVAYRIYISALSTLNLDDHNRIRTTDARLLRRLVRDRQFRGTPFEETLAMWPSVRRGEEKWIFPYQEEADIMFNSALAYEQAALKAYAYPQLAAIDESSPYFTQARRLVKFLAYFRPADIEMELGPTAILREFIGGNSFYMA